MTALPDPPETTSGLKVWRGISPKLVLDFLDGYAADPAAAQTQPKALTNYIRSRVTDGELTSWTVALADVSSGPPSELAGVQFGLTRRTALDQPVPLNRFTVRRVGSPRHEIIDLDRDSPLWEELLQKTVGAWSESTRTNKSATPPIVPGGLFERQARPPQRGLLLIYPLDPEPARRRDSVDGPVDPEEKLDTPLVGFAISFPYSPQAKPVAYQVNQVFWEQEYGPDSADEDEA